MIKALILIAVLMLSISPVFAETIQYCSSNVTMTRIKEVTVNIPQRNITRTLNSTENVYCPYGCSNNECMLPPWFAYAIIFGLIITASFIYLVFIRSS
jgi:hypothetical protein